jgi:hypothetical protein
MDQNAIQPGTASDAPATSSNEGSGSVFGDLLRTLGIGQGHADEVHRQAQSGDVHQQIDAAHKYVTDALQHAREQASKNPSLVLGGLSALVIAAGMIRNHTGSK